MWKNEIEAYLSHLASNVKVSASTQKQAMNSILFFYCEVLDILSTEQLENNIQFFGQEYFFLLLKIRLPAGLLRIKIC
jgi:hypothetical protein